MKTTNDPENRLQPYPSASVKFSLEIELYREIIVVTP